ncbi:MAG: hypothetical protein WCA84_04965 [Ignavibacteriaceae bacterium]
MKIKIILLSFLLLSFYQFALAQSIIYKYLTNLQNAGLLGHVKQIKNSCYAASEKFGEIVENRSKFYDGTISYKYDDKGNLIEIQNYDSVGSVGTKYLIKYDKIGNWIETNIYNPDGSLYYKNIIKYDGKGNMVETNGYHSDGSLDIKIARKYDSKRNIIEIDWFNQDGYLFQKEVYKYDDKRYGFKWDFFRIFQGTPGLNTHKEGIAKLDRKGNCIESECYDVDMLNHPLVEKNIRTYNKNGNLIKTYHFESPYNKVLEYNNTWTYEYDIYGNWIKKTEYKDSIVKFVNIRDIEYYSK